MTAVVERKGTVLCVDDEPGILRSLQWLLQKDYDVQIAQGGEAALALLKDADFDVIISDQRMPKMTGAEFLRQAKALSPRSMRLLLTGYSDMQALLSSVNDGEIWRFIKKPWDNNELKQVVREARDIALATPEIAAVDASAEPAGAEKASVLCIENGDELCRQLSASLDTSRVSLAYSHNLFDAIHTISTQPIGVILTEVKVGAVDISRFVALLKRKKPEVVVVAVAEEADAEQLVGLINNGQIYRFGQKPMDDGFLRLALRSAVLKHKQLIHSPSLQKRYQSADSSEDLEALFIEELELVADQSGAGAPSASAASGLFSRIKGRLSRLFG